MATITPNGISFDGLHSYTDFGLWLVARPDTGSPQPKLNRVEVPGMDGIIDMTEINAGEVKFTNRTMVFRFAGKVGINDQAAFKAAIMDALHGKRIEKIILDEDSLWYYSGRVTVQFPEAKPWKVYCTITVDAEPYALKSEETVINFDLTQTPSYAEYVIAEKENNVYSYFFHLGTRVFPDGLNFTTSETLFWVFWQQNGLIYHNQRIRIRDADGHECNKNITNPYAPGYYYGPDEERGDIYGVSFSQAELVSAGVDSSKVWSVMVQGFTWSKLAMGTVANKYVVTNSRKNVIPVFELDATESILIWINGVQYEIAPGYTQNPDIVLGEGAFDIFVFEGTSTVTSFTMRYQEGKL